MSLIVVNVDGATWLGNAIGNELTAGPATIHTYSTIASAASRATILADLTESAYGGYPGGQSLSSYTPAVLVGNRGVIVFPTFTWSGDGSGSTENVLGVYVINSIGQLIWVEPFFTPISGMGPVGTSFSFGPNFTMASEFP